jgi:hypothetical protein
MNAPRFTKRLAILLAAAALPITVSAQAAGGDAGASRSANASTSCEAARELAHFQRQLRMTEGDTEPLQPAEPRECRAARVEADGRKDAGRTATETPVLRADDSSPYLGGA